MSGEDESIQKPEAEKINCDEDSSHEAVVFCLQCATCLCNECFETVHSPNSLRLHQKVAVELKPEPVTKCPVHPHNVSELYCVKPDCEASNRVMCSTCHQYEHHIGHDHCMLKDHVNQLKDKLKKAVNVSNGCIEEFEKERKELGSVLESYSSEALDSKLGKIQKHVDDIIKVYKTAQEQVSEKLKEKFENLRENVEADIEKVGEMTKNQETWKAEAERILKMNTMDFLNAVDGSLNSLSEEKPDTNVHMHSDCVNIGPLTVPENAIKRRTEDNIAFFPMGDDFKMKMIVNWMKNNSSDYSEADSKLSFTFKDDQVNFWICSDVNVKTGAGKIVLLYDQSEVDLDEFCKSVEILTGKNTDDISYIFAIKQSAGDGSFVSIEQKIRCVNKNPIMFYYDNVFEEDLMELVLKL